MARLWKAEYPVAAVLAVCVYLVGCASRHAVVASTGTSIGVEIAQNPANQVPHAKLGYQRAEVAIVPTNRDAREQAGETKGGAADSADVLMELRYSGIFSWGESTGIYQRLAVGKTAVSQRGAAAMFLKDSTGKVDEKAAEVLKNVLAIPEHQVGH